MFAKEHIGYIGSSEASAAMHIMLIGALLVIPMHFKNERILGGKERLALQDNHNPLRTTMLYANPSRNLSSFSSLPLPQTQILPSRSQFSYQQACRFNDATKREKNQMRERDGKDDSIEIGKRFLIRSFREER